MSGIAAKVRWVATVPAACGAAVGLAGGGYLGVLTANAWRARSPFDPDNTPTVVVLVPAHDERLGIATTVAGLLRAAYPPERRRVVVIADNCTDDTAAQAAAAGAVVWERVDPDHRGKGYALRWAFDRILADGGTDVVVVVDADTLVAANLLTTIGGAVRAGADVVQVDYRVRNPAASWRTRLMDVAFTCSHRVRGRGREALGLSAGLRGNGMAFTTRVLRAHPPAARSAVEDVEYGVELGLAGVRIWYVDATNVDGDMPASADAARSQRTRWEVGRSEIRRRFVPPLTRRAIGSGDALAADLAADLVLPPMVTTVAAAVASVLISPLASRSARRPIRAAAGVGLAGIAAHVLSGVALSQSSWRAVPALLRVPGYALWKVRLAVSKNWRNERRTGTQWTRSQRSYEPPSPHTGGPSMATSTNPSPS